jgi:hypothetical protein
MSVSPGGVVGSYSTFTGVPVLMNTTICVTFRRSSAIRP